MDFEENERKFAKLMENSSVQKRNEKFSFLDEEDSSDDEQTMEGKLESTVERIENNPNANLQNGSTFDEMVDLEKIIKLAPIGATDFQLASIDDIEERSKYIPLRLDLKERKKLRLIEAALAVSEYTDKVDILRYGDKTKRIHQQLREICAILSGLLVASDYTAGQELVSKRNFKDNETFFRDLFEIGRRHKVMNPEKMRSEYGKLVYLLMDASYQEVRDMLEFDCRKKLVVVHDYLTEKGAGGVLKDPRIGIATQEIIDDGKKTRPQIQKMIKDKERAVEEIAIKFQNPKIEAEEIRVCLRSIGDNNSFLRYTSYPLEKIIHILENNFSPTKIDQGYSLAIYAGMNGARLTHDHARQYNYVWQTLTLWKEICKDMFRLWILAEDDLLNENNRYRLVNTGQGLNRVQGAPRVGHAMHSLLYKTQQKIGGWVGSSVIHLGDHNVPNALMFIDKYTQVPRIINPIIITIEQIDKLIEDPGIKFYFDRVFGGPDKLKKDILLDFFRFAFDGSGADNFFDAGSCVDGRLTSAWNWCSKLEKKPYFPAFKLAGFNGFDGDFQK